MVSLGRKDVFFVEWDKEVIGFIKGITLSPSLRSSVVVHIFYPQNIPQKFLPNYRPWLFKHPIPSDTRHELLQDYIMKFTFKGEKKLVPVKTSSKWTKELTLWHYHLAMHSEDKSQELVKNIKGQFGVEVLMFDGKEKTLLDHLDFKCVVCKVAFKEKRELTQHEKNFHNFLCLNTQCKHNLKQNCFSNENDYTSHVLSQSRCKFCPGTVFCSAENLELHMKRTHKKCSCPCGEYFGSRQTYLDHFFSHYPSPTSVSVPNVEIPQKQEKIKQRYRQISQSQRQSDKKHETSMTEDEHAQGKENDNESFVSLVLNGNDDCLSESSSIADSDFENE